MEEREEKIKDIYLDWVKKSMREGRNLVSEKYGRMMKYTDPDYYRKNIEGEIPALSEEQEELIDGITDALTKWEEEFSGKYPKLSRASRPVRVSDDDCGFTSVETYNRGELGTYSVELLKAYMNYICKLKAEGKSISIMDRTTMAGLYGYKSIEEAEASMR